MIDERIKVPSADLAVTSVGEGDAVVCVHAGVADRRSWASLADALRDRCRIISYDARGYGDTHYEPATHDPAADLAAVVDWSEASPVVLVGNSLGARTVVDFALDHSSDVRGLILIGPAIRGAPAPEVDDLPDFVLELDTAVDEAEARGDIAEANRLEAHLWLDGPASPEGRVSGPIRSLFLDMNGRALAAPSPGAEIERSSAWDRLEEIHAPTVVVGGALDLPHFVERQRVIANKVPGAQLVEIADAAHLVALERPAEVAAIVHSLLA